MNDQETRRRKLEQASAELCIMIAAERRGRAGYSELRFIEGCDHDGIYFLGAELLELPLHRHPEPFITETFSDRENGAEQRRTRVQLEAAASMLVQTYYLASSLRTWESALDAPWAEEPMESVEDTCWELMVRLGEILRQPGDVLVVEPGTAKEETEDVEGVEADEEHEATGVPV